MATCGSAQNQFALHCSLKALKQAESAKLAHFPRFEQSCSICIFLCPFIHGRWYEHPKTPRWVITNHVINVTIFQKKKGSYSKINAHSKSI